MNTALLTPYYGDDMPIVFFDEVADEAWYKVYNDGGHYVATRRIQRKRPIFCLTACTPRLSARACVIRRTIRQ